MHKRQLSEIQLMTIVYSTVHGYLATLTVAVLPLLRHLGIHCSHVDLNVGLKSMLKQREE